MAVDINAVIARYVELRAQAEAIDADAKARKKVVTDQMEKIEAALMALMNRDKITQLKGPAGTAFVTTKTDCSVEDFDTTIAYIRQNEAWHLLNRAVNKTAVGKHIETHETPPPGVRWNVTREVQIRKS